MRLALLDHTENVVVEHKHEEFRDSVVERFGHLTGERGQRWMRTALERAFYEVEMEFRARSTRVP